MTKNDFLYILADAIQKHEGWGKFANGAWIATRSVLNNNQGNIKFVGQLGAKEGADNFCVTPGPIEGKALQIHDLTLKLAKFNTIRDIISLYAPPSDGNDTEAYITAVCQFFKRRNFNVTDTMTIDEILALPQEVALIINNGQNSPAEWASFQSSIDQLATVMPQFGFSCRYVNHPVTPADFYPNPSPMGNIYALNESVTRPLVALFNEGQKLNCLMYVVLGLSNPAGGVQYGGEAVSYGNRETSFCNVFFEGASFDEWHKRAIFHEFIHSLFTLTGVKDYLHDYLVAHGGYQANQLVDLQTVYADIIAKYKTDETAVTIAKEVISIAQNDNNPHDRSAISLLLSAIGQYIKNLIVKK